ncbi:hypothetical protein KEM52_000536 [Ascosphaera acerosa]|nr:hypothetical protein KEM52_000536 [Ascosphaera acerosa]
MPRSASLPAHPPENRRARATEQSLASAQRALDNLFAILTPEQIQTFLHELNAVGVATAGVKAEKLTMAPPAPAVSLEASPPDSAQRARGVLRRCRPSKHTEGHTRLRPLNSFIAFRSYYSSIFPNLSQKVKSGLLREIWKSDPFKAKWTILAKAYSRLRDSHTDQVSLDSFLLLSGPLIGIIPPDDYLKTMGLRLSKGRENRYSMSVHQTDDSLSQSELTTNLSVDDIVAYCYDSGYVSGRAPQAETDMHKIGVAMAVTAQTTRHSCPYSHKRESFCVRPLKVRAHVTDEVSEKISTPPSLPRQSQSAISSLATLVNGNLKIVLDGPDEKSKTLILSETPYHAAEFDTKLRNAINQFRQEDDSYLALFNPTAQAPVVVYNPYEVQDDFDAFEIGGYIPM